MGNNPVLKKEDLEKVKVDTVKTFLTDLDDEINVKTLEDVRPAILASAEEDNGNVSLKFFKVGLLRISFSSAEKSKILSTFGDSFVIQSFGHLPTFLSLEGFMISYGYLKRGSIIEDLWRNSASFNAFYRSVLNRMNSNKNEDSKLKYVLLYYNGMFYKCLFDRFTRTKSLPMDTLEYFSASGVVLKKFEVPFSKSTVKITSSNTGIKVDVK